MSFMNIKDHDKRDKIFREYIALKKKIKDRNEAERSAGLSQRRDLEEQFEPITSSQREITRTILEHLKPMKDQLDNLAIVKEEDDELPQKRQKIETEYGPLAKIFKARVLSGDEDLDTSFGIRFLMNGQPVIANTRIKIDGDDIVIGSEAFQGTPGLWSLLTDSRPRDWTQDDMEKYEEILDETNVLHQDYDPENKKPRASSSWKWKKILSPIWVKSIINGSGLVFPRGCRVYLQKNGHCCRVKKRGNGLYLQPRPIVVKRSDGLFVKAGRTIYDGRGFTLPPMLVALVTPFSE